MHPETQAFLQGLFKRCDTSRQSAFVTFTAIHPDGEHSTPSRHIPIHDTAAMSQALDCLLVANHQGWGAYIGIAPRRYNLGRWKRGTKRDLAELPALFVDIDTLVPDTLERIRCFPLPPSCVVSSGRGLHVYWYLASPTRYFATADATLRGLAQVFGGDSHMNVSQSLRIPGTVNNKVGQAQTLCRLVDLHPERRYDLTDLSSYATQYHPKNNRSRRHDASELGVQQFRETVHMIAECLLHEYDGYIKRNGWIASLCPFGHVHDRPGQHFGYHPANGVGFCFGCHGKVSLMEMCQRLRIAMA